MPNGISIGSVPEHMSISDVANPFLILDRFTDADNTALTAHNPNNSKTGNDWVVWNGTFTTVGNQAELGTAGGGQEVNAVDMGQADYEIICDFYLSTEIVNADGGIIFRGVDSDNYWMLVTVTGQAWTVYKNALGFTADTQTVSVSTAGDTYEIRITCVGNTVTCYLDGAQILAPTLSGTDSGTFIGVRIHSANDSTGGSYFDNLRVSPL